MVTSKSKRKAFTLVEILITICIIGILFIVLVSRVDFATDKSRQAGVQNDFHSMQTALHVIALKNNSFMDDVSTLANELNKNLDSEMSVRVENGVIKTNALDPWGSEYVLEYDQPSDTNGRVTLLSPGPDTILRTEDDITSEVVIKLENGKTNVVINNSQSTPNGGEHVCVYNRRVSDDRYIATRGNCITPTVYYFSCSCGMVGTDTFHGSVDLDTHIGEPRIEYQTLTENHNVLTYCSSCNVLLSTVPEAHNMVNEECTICHKVIHNHNYDVDLVTPDTLAAEATCTSKATYYYSCNCGDVGTDTFEYGEVRSHIFTNDSTEHPVQGGEATCNSRAQYYKTCSSCGLVGVEIFEAGSYNYNNHSGVPTPKYGQLSNTHHTKQMVCSVCKHDLPNVQPIEEEHSFDDNNTCTLCDEHVHLFTKKSTDEKYLNHPASCTEAASYFYGCVGCDAIGTDTFNVGIALSHNEHAEVPDAQYFKSDATCLVPTIYYKSCTGCGHKGESTFTVGQALGHIEVKTNGYAATCTETGLTEGITCSRCNEIIKMPVVINPLGHTEVVTKGTAATCTTAGTTDQVTCSTCNTVLTYSSPIAAIGHDIIYTEGYAPTCSMPGRTTGEHCSRCSYTVTAEEIPTLPHTEVVDPAVGVTCTTDGYTAGKHCSVCYAVTEPQTMIPATGHNEVVLPAVAATCTQSGVSDGKQCSICNELLVIQNHIPATGHTEVIDNAIAATCTSEGRTAGSHCSKCNTIISGTSVIAKLDHNYDIEIINPQCITPGFISYTCKVCSHTTIEELEATGHIDNNFDNKCDICSATINDSFIPTYALSGMWFFNEELSIDPIECTINSSDNTKSFSGEESITFTSDGQTYYGMFISYNEKKNPPSPRIFKYLDFGYLNSQSNSTWTPGYAYNDGMEGYGWASQEKRLIDFGMQPQEVTQEFYEWFVANATPYIQPTYELSGKWIFNTNINAVEMPYEQINFIVNGINYKAMGVEYEEGIRPGTYTLRLAYSTIYPPTLQSVNFVYFYEQQPSDGSDEGPTPYAMAPDQPDEIETGTWSMDVLKNIDFGDEPQTVSPTFYEWFIANAIPDAESQKQCIHQTTNTIIRNATCSQTGVESQTCYVCCTINYVILPTIAHELTTINGYEATCTRAGQTDGTQCAVCNAYIVKPSAIAALGHNLTTIAQLDVTCENDGYITSNCTRCNETIHKTLTAPGHKDVVKDGICDVCNIQIKYKFTINNDTYFFTYNMTWNDWLNSEFNTSKLVPVGYRILQINEENLSCYQLTLAKVTVNMGTGSGSGTFYQPKPSDLITADAYMFAQPAKDSFVITTDGDFLSGDLKYADLGEGLKNGEIYVVVLHGHVFYNHEDAFVTISIAQNINGYYIETSTIAAYTFKDTITLTRNGSDVVWYYADQNGNPIGNPIVTGNTISVNESCNLACFYSDVLELPFKENGTNKPLKNETIELYDASGKLVNKFTTNAQGIATIAGLKPEAYICKSKYETWNISFNASDSGFYLGDDGLIHSSTNFGFNATMVTPRCSFTLTLTSGTSGTLYIYSTNNELINTVTTSNKKFELELVVGEYIIKINNQSQKQKLTIDNDGNIIIIPLE